jgi:hypothetical protein
MRLASARRLSRPREAVRPRNRSTLPLKEEPAVDGTRAEEQLSEQCYTTDSAYRAESDGLGSWGEPSPSSSLFVRKTMPLRHYAALSRPDTSPAPKGRMQQSVGARTSASTSAAGVNARSAGGEHLPG